MNNLMNAIVSRLVRTISGQEKNAENRQSRNCRLDLEMLESRLVPSRGLDYQAGPPDIPNGLPSAPRFTLNDIEGKHVLINPAQILKNIPVNVEKINGLETHQISVSWEAVPGATSYVIEEMVNGNFKRIGTTPAITRTFTETGLISNQLHIMRVGAVNSHGTTYAEKQSIRTIDHPAACDSYQPVEAPLFKTTGPNYQEVRQGAVGDCWLDASLAEVAAKDSNAITSMFSYLGKQNENGIQVDVFQVRFYDRQSNPHYVTVDNLFPAGGSTYDHPNGVLWVALAEKAYAQANYYGWITTGHPVNDSYSALDYGNPGWALQAIAGGNIDIYSSITPSNLLWACTHLKYVVMCTPSNPASPFIIPHHCYAVVEYNPGSDYLGGWPYEIYNPWGTDSFGDGGVFNGHAVYGLFWQGADFIAQNFTSIVSVSNFPQQGFIQQDTATFQGFDFHNYNLAESGHNQTIATEVTMMNTSLNAEIKLSESAVEGMNNSSLRNHPLPSAIESTLLADIFWLESDKINHLNMMHVINN